MIGHAEYAQKVEESERYSKEAYTLKKEVARLKELNREMVAALKIVADGVCKNTECEEVVNKVLAKAEGRGE